MIQMMTDIGNEDNLLPELSKPDALVAGVDEVGRGALFGPVVAAAVALPCSKLPQLKRIGVKDSKQLSDKKRRELVQSIQEIVTSWQIGFATVAEIDRLNILQASLLAMKRAVLQLTIQPEICLVDGKIPIPDLSITQKTIIQGDRNSTAIAAASILAKVWRDDLIIQLATDYPEYGLVAHKGYPTKQHLLALDQYGLSPHHRSSFRPCQIYSLSKESLAEAQRAQRE
jgi:ribonuclease HII